MDTFVTWFAPIVSTLIICAGQLALNTSFKRADERKEKKQHDEEAWRKQVTERLDAQDAHISTMLGAQCSQMRSDLIHRAHRYMDDLGCASIEEKNAFWDEYTKYCEMCDISDVENGFIENMVKAVMDLPNRSAA